MIDERTIENILATANIVEVVSEFVPLLKLGENYVGMCPFHKDKNPSMFVSTSKGVFKCFTCGEGGNAVQVLMKYRQMNYNEAFRWLAKKYNIVIPR